MKITLTELKQIIRQEVRRARRLNEAGLYVTLTTTGQKVQDKIAQVILRNIDRPAYKQMERYLKSGLNLDVDEFSKYLVNFAGAIHIGGEKSLATQFNELDYDDKYQIMRRIKSDWRGGKLFQHAQRALEDRAGALEDRGMGILSI